MEISRIQFLYKSSFYYLQRNYLYPAINHVYDEKRKCILNGVKSKTLNLIGDGRYDSPGNNVTFGTYTLMNSGNSQILDFFIAHVKNAGNSQRMEAYAFRKTLDMIIDIGVIISSITTDRHKQIKKILREKYPEILINSMCGTLQNISTSSCVVMLS